MSATKKKKELTAQEVFWAARDSTVQKGAERWVLWALASRCRQDAAGNFVCFPSYEQLADDCQQTPKTCRGAAKRLEDAGLIQRIDPETDLSFIINHKLLLEYARTSKIDKREKLIAKRKAASELAGKKMRERTQHLIDLTEGDYPEPSSEDPDDTDGLEITEPDDEYNEDEPGEERSLSDTRNVPQIIDFLRWGWEGHPSFTEKGGDFFLEKDLNECVAIAGSPERVGEVLGHIYNEYGPTFTSLRESTKLGLYLKKCLQQWLNDYPTELSNENEEAE